MKATVGVDAVKVSRVRDLDAATLRAAHALAHAAFGDDAAFLTRLTDAAADERYLYIRADGGIAAGCFVFDAALYTGTETVRGGYLYALCTAAAYRGRGFAHALLGAAVRIAGDFLVAVPASRSLCDFYRRAGFSRILSGCAPRSGTAGSCSARGCLICRLPRAAPRPALWAMRSARCATADCTAPSACGRSISCPKRRSCAARYPFPPTASSRICCSRCSDSAEGGTGRRGRRPLPVCAESSHTVGRGLAPAADRLPPGGKAKRSPYSGEPNDNINRKDGFYGLYPACRRI